MTLLVCLCGAPQFPNLSGVRPPTEEQVTRGLLDGIAGVYEAAPARCLERLRGDWCSQAATLAQCQQLEKEVDELQQRLYELFPIITGNRLFGRRRWRGASHRQADSQGRDQLVVALQRCGVPFRRAGEIVSAIVGIWTAALARGEAVELPVGRLVRRKQKIRWEPERGSFPSEKLPFLPEKFMHPHPDKHITCERCGSPWFAECEFRQYAASAYSQKVGGDTHRIPKRPGPSGRTACQVDGTISRIDATLAVIVHHVFGHAIVVLSLASSTPCQSPQNNGSSTSGKQGIHRPVQAIPAPIASNGRTLGQNFLGSDIKAAISAVRASAASPPKSEFETTEQYNLRLRELCPFGKAA